MENFNRTERLLALILIEHLKGGSQVQKILRLNLAGFTNVEIADLLETSANVVAVQLAEARRKKRPKKR
jgi:hypothetical protein